MDENCVECLKLNSNNYTKLMLRHKHQCNLIIIYNNSMVFPNLIQFLFEKKAKRQ